MKKKLAFCFSVAIMFLTLTGCGSSKQLICTQEINEDGMKNSLKLTINFKNDIASNMNMSMNIEVGDDYKDYLEQIKESLEDQFDSYEEEGMDVDVSTDDNIILLKLSADFDQMSDDQKENLGFNTADNTYDAIKKSFEEDGYTCK